MIPAIEHKFIAKGGGKERVGGDRYRARRTASGAPGLERAVFAQIAGFDDLGLATVEFDLHGVAEQPGAVFADSPPGAGAHGRSEQSVADVAGGYDVVSLVPLSAERVKALCSRSWPETQGNAFPQLSESLFWSRRA